LVKGEDDTMSGKIVNFNKREQDDREAFIEEMEALKEDFLNTIEKEESEIAIPERLVEILKELWSKGEELVFRNPNEASIFATYFLSLPQNKDVSHFEIAVCTSRLSVFYKLRPFYKDESTQYVFPSNELLDGINLQSLNKEINRMKAKVMN